MNKKGKTIFFIVVIQSIFISILVVKIINRNIFLNKPSINPINKSNLIFNPRNKLKYFYELKPKINQTEKADWLKTSVTYIINSDGLNETKEYIINKPANTFRIITLGDSFTYGQFVNTENNWTEKLENLLNNKLSCPNINKYEVINLGIYGYDIQYAIERYRIRGQKYNPDLILWFLKDDDFAIINEYILPKEKEVRAQKKFDKDSDFYFSKNGNTYPTWQIAIEQFTKEFGKDQILKFQKNALNEINNYYKNKLYIFSFQGTKDEYKSIINSILINRSYSYFYDKLIDIYKIKENFPDMHPTEKGHQLIAEDLFNNLTKNKIIPCN